MNHQEAVLLLRKVAAYQPNQRIDELTADAWAEALEDYEYLDANDAVKKLVRTPRQPGMPFWFDIRDIIAEMDHVIGQRIFYRQCEIGEPPSEVDYIEWIQEMNRAIKKRDWTSPRQAELTRRPVAELTASVVESWGADV